MPRGCGQLSNVKTGSNTLASPAVKATASGPGRSTTSATSGAGLSNSSASACPRAYATCIALVKIGTSASASGCAVRVAVGSAVFGVENGADSSVGT